MGLQDLDQEYATIDAAERKGGGPLPDGRYNVRVDRVELTDTSNNNPMLVFQVIVEGGTLDGRKHTFNRVITQNSLPHVKADLKILGWTHKLSDLHDHGKLAAILDQKLAIAIKTKGQSVVNGKTYDNKDTYINGKAGQVAADASPASAAQPVREAQAVVDPAPAATPANSRTGGIVKRTVVKGPKNKDEPPF